MANTLDHVLHIGAGLCTQLPEYLAAGTRSITLLEPAPETAASLRAQAFEAEGSVITTEHNHSHYREYLHRLLAGHGYTQLAKNGMIGL